MNNAGWIGLVLMAIGAALGYIGIYGWTDARQLKLPAASGGGGGGFG